MQKNNNEKNKIKDASWVEELIEGMNKLDLESTLGQRQFYNDYSEATNLVFENPEIVNANPEILKKMIKLSLQTELSIYYLGKILESLGDKIEPDIWIDVFSDEEIFKEVTDVILDDGYYIETVMNFETLCLRLVDYEVERIENNNNDDNEKNQSNKKTNGFLKNLYGIYEYKKSKEYTSYQTFDLELLKRIDRIRDIVFEDETARNMVDAICEYFLGNYSNRDEKMPDYFYEYLGNRIPKKGYDLNSLLYLASDNMWDFIKNNKYNPKYKSIVECYDNVEYGKIHEIKDIDKEDIHKLDERYKEIL